METPDRISPETSVQFVKGIGPRRAELLRQAGVESIEDLITYYPRRYLDRSHISKISSLQPGQDVTVVGKVLHTEIRRSRRSRFIVHIEDGTGLLFCVWFQGIKYISKAFKPGQRVAFSGKVTFFRGPQLVHPDFDRISEADESDPLHTAGIVPLYPSTEALKKNGLDSRGFRRVIRRALNVVAFGPELLPEVLLRKRELIPRRDALEAVHFPQDPDRLERAKHRVKYEELFLLQFYLAFVRHQRDTRRQGIAFESVGPLTRKFIESLPFELTEAQKRVSHDIRADMKSSRTMNRLLQGDVGAGKTVVASIAMLVAVENGYQAALMAPTEILAEQHFLTLKTWFEPLGLRISMHKSGQKSVERREYLSAIESGEVQIAVGTHALIQEGVDFHNLGLVVIDEQHRFGVMQRAIMRGKGSTPDVLVMTATPIPRTLALTLYGDLDVSMLDELPAGRHPVRTVWRKEGKRPLIYEFIAEEVQKGHQAYIVYPLVEESEKLDLAAATEGYNTLSESIFPDFSIALLHGRMKSDQKESVMRAFKAGEVQILVCTTVIEVGVDVPNATLMLLEHAERFGLTQLHQLRGRIGRGEHRSTCILLSGDRMTDEAVTRLETMVETNDGFRIAEADLALRGPGELFGTRQHGLLQFKMADLITDREILNHAREDAFALMQTDPDSELPVHAIIRDLCVRKYQKQASLIEVG